MGRLEEDWNNLLTSILDKSCIPFIGSGILTIKFGDGKPLVSLSRNIVEKWKEQYSYPLEDLYNLAKVHVLEDPNKLAKLAQFLEIERIYDEKLMYPKNMLKDILKGIEESSFSSQIKDKSPFDTLADLDLPIYMTTNYDNFMELSLSKYQKKFPQSEFCRWNEDLIKYVKTFEIHPYLIKEVMNRL